MYESVKLAFTEDVACHLDSFTIFSTKAQELLQQTAAENAEKQVELEEAGAFIFSSSVLTWNCETPLHGFVVPVGMTNMHTTESPNCLANHEAKARAHQTEEKYKELQVGQCVECGSSAEMRMIFISPHQVILA